MFGKNLLAKDYANHHSGVNRGLMASKSIYLSILKKRFSIMKKYAIMFFMNIREFFQEYFAS
jgi:hypothetical protein